MPETVQMVYTGQTEDGGKLYQQWIEIVEGQTLAKSIRLFTKLEKHPLVGGVYEFNVKNREGERLVVGMPGRWMRQWPIEEDRQLWQLQDRLSREMRAARREFLPDEVMDPVRRMYHHTPAMHRTAFIAWLMTAIQKRPSKGE